MKKMKKMFALLLAAGIVMSSLSVSASSGNDISNIQVVEQGGKTYYLADPEEGEAADETNFDVWTSKTIAGTEKEDEFEITLQVGTTMKAVPNDVAVVLVMDTSCSMMVDADGRSWGAGNVPEGTKLRIDYAREAALSFAEGYAEGSGNAQRMMAVVEFGNNAYTVLPWTDANDNGSLRDSVEEAISAVDVNFVYDNRSFWDEEAAKAKWGSDPSWDGTPYAPEMQDLMQDLSQSYMQDYMTDYMQSYLVTEQVSVTSGNDLVDIDVTSCTFSGCTETEEHTHCSYQTCTEAGIHKHCSVETCNGRVDAHFHCDYPECAVSTDHTHCTVEGCAVTTAHVHCSYEECEVSESHTHCAECGVTTEHTHIAGCKVSGCEDTIPDHEHYCTYSGDSLYYPYVNGYRCVNSDPSHTHDVYDGDSYYVLEDRETQKYKTVATNMEGGLLLARNLVNAGLGDGGAIEGIDDVYVILLSDGVPSWHTNSTSETEQEFVEGVKGGHSCCDWADVEDIVYDEKAAEPGTESDMAIAEDIKKVADLYAILYGTSLNQAMGYGKRDHALAYETGENWIKTQNTINYMGADAVFDSPEAGGLNTVFSEIKERIDMLAKAWVVTDEMGGIELGDDVNFEGFTMNGEYAVAAAAAGDRNTTVSWSLGAMNPEAGNGSVQDPYVYSLKYKVTLNSAKDNVKAVSLAHDAGTSAEAVWTNNNASLQYFMVDKEDLDSMTPEQIAASMRSADFARPSVKGIYGDYGFVKKNGETGTVMEGAGFTLYDSNDCAYGTEVFSDSGGKVIFTDIPRGDYTLKETTVPDGMQQMDDMAMKVSWGEVTAADGGTLPEEIGNWPIGSTFPDNNEGSEGSGGTDPVPGPGEGDGEGEGADPVPGPGEGEGDGEGEGADPVPGGGNEGGEGPAPDAGGLRCAGNHNGIY